MSKDKPSLVCAHPGCYATTDSFGIHMCDDCGARFCDEHIKDRLTPIQISGGRKLHRLCELCTTYYDSETPLIQYRRMQMVLTESNDLPCILNGEGARGWELAAMWDCAAEDGTTVVQVLLKRVRPRK